MKILREDNLPKSYSTTYYELDKEINWIKYFQATYSSMSEQLLLEFFKDYPEFEIINKKALRTNKIVKVVKLKNPILYSMFLLEMEFEKSFNKTEDFEFLNTVELNKY